MSDPISTFVRCVGRRNIKEGPFASIRAVHILLGAWNDPQSLEMAGYEILEQVNDLSRVGAGFLHHVVILGADDGPRQQTAFLLAEYLTKYGSWIENVWVAPPVPTDALPVRWA